jgi:integrase
MFADGLGLYLQVARNGSRSWTLRYRIGGRRRYLGLGALPSVSLADARERAAAARLILQDGRDPIEVKRGQRAATHLTAAKVMTFSKVAAAYVDAHKAGWTTKTAGSIAAAIQTYANPTIGALPIGEIDTGLVMQVLEPIWTTKSETANRLRQYLEAILDFAKVRGHRSGENPARWKGHLDHILPAKSKVAPVQNLKALPYAEVGAFMARLRELPSIDARALEFAILTAARSGEVLGAKWEEIDLRAKLWTVPAQRMKARRDHRVPLAPAVVALLGAFPGPHIGPLFPGRKAGTSINRTRLLAVLRQLNPDVTVHGFRSAFRDWAGDRTAFARETIEAALAHAVGDRTEAAYRRGDALEKRRKLMEAWGTFCSMPAAPSAEVVELHRA